MNDRKRYAFLILLILFFAVFVSIWKSNKNDNVDKDENAAQIEELRLSVDFITQEEILQIGKMQSLRKLSFLINDEDIDLSPLGNLIYLEELEIQSCIGECYNLDTQPLGELKSLREISLMHCSFDTSFLAELTSLEKIFMLKCDEFEDLSVLENLEELQDLYIEYVNDSNLNYLKNLTKLEKIHIVGGNIRNFEGLKDMVNMKSVYLSENGYEAQSLDMNTFIQMNKLEDLLIAHINIKDINPLSNMKNLEYISLINTGITDIQSLVNLRQLKYLDIFGNDSKLVEEQIEKYFAYVETVHISGEIPYPFSDYQAAREWNVGSEEKMEMKNDIDKNAGNEQEYVNPYAEYTETFSGGYLYDIYEANRGSSADGNWFIDGSERFTYYKAYNPLGDENRNIKWCIELAEMKGADNLAEEFNNYHNDLFESRKEKMEKSRKKVLAMSVDELDISLERYGNQICTRASFWWGNIFTVVDIVDPHYRGCYTVIANFNSVSGKQYELRDLFCVDNYTEELIDIIKAQLDGYDNGWSIELESPEELSFVIGYQGLLLIDNTSARSILIGWNELKNILSQEILNELEFLCNMGN